MKPLEGACPGWYRSADGQGWTSQPHLAVQVPDDYDGGSPAVEAPETERREDLDLLD